MNLKRFLSKRNILTAGVILIGILLIVLVLVLSGRGRKDVRFSGGEDSSYPYSWTEYRDGSIVVRPCSAVPDGYSWFVEENDDTVVRVSQTGGKQEPAFTVTSAGEGDSLLKIDLAESQGSVCLASLYMVIESSDSGKQAVLTVTGHRMDEAEGFLIGGEYGVSYLVITDDNGDLQLKVSGSGEDDWGCFIKTPRIVTDAYTSHNSDTLTARLYAVNTGDAKIVVYSYSRGISLEITANSTADGTVRPESCTVKKHEDWAQKNEACALAGLIMPVITIPDEAEDVAFSAFGSGGLLVSGSVSFTYLGISWTATATDTASFVEMMDVDEYDTDPSLYTFITQAGAMYAYFKDPLNVAAWCDAEDLSYYIEGRSEESAGEIDIADLIETANIVMGADR